MMTPLKSLLKLKQGKQLNALKALESKRREVAIAHEAHAKTASAVVESRAGYSSRVERLYAPIMGQTVGLDSIEVVEGHIAQLDLDLEALIDVEQDAFDRVEELEEAQTQLLAAYGAAIRVSDKYQTLNSIIEEHIREAAERLEEMELEEGFGHNRQRFT